MEGQRRDSAGTAEERRQDTSFLSLGLPGTPTDVPRDRVVSPASLESPVSQGVPRSFRDTKYFLLMLMPAVTIVKRKLTSLIGSNPSRNMVPRQKSLELTIWEMKKGSCVGVCFNHYFCTFSHKPASLNHLAPFPSFHKLLIQYNLHFTPLP